MLVSFLTHWMVHLVSSTTQQSKENISEIQIIVVIMYHIKDNCDSYQQHNGSHHATMGLLNQYPSHHVHYWIVYHHFLIVKLHGINQF